MLETIIQPRFGESDALGHINNTVLPTWFEEARRPIFEVIHPAMTLEDWPLVIAHIDVDFIKQMFVNEEVKVSVSIEKIGKKSLTLYHQAVQSNQIAATGRAVLVFFDFQSQETTKIPNSIREKLEELYKDHAMDKLKEYNQNHITE